MTEAGGQKPGGCTAAVLGGTGLVGSELLELLLGDPRYERVVAIGRRKLKRRHPKLSSEKIDFERMQDFAHLFRADDVFCSLGTTLAAAGSADGFRRVDHDYVVEAARLAAEQQAEQFLLVSALGADPSSRVFYNRVKGEAETAVKHCPFRALWILRPSLLRGDRAEVRMGEKLADLASRPLSFMFVGPLRRYRPVEARDVATALVKLAAAEGTGGVIESEEIPAIAAGAAPAPT